MKKFVNVKTVLDEDQRSISGLQNLYEDKTRLISVIADVIGEHLNEQNVKDKRILLKPNWVRHSKNEEDEWCLRTHDNFLLATLEFVLKLRPNSILIGDAPIQGCNWDKMVSIELLSSIDALSILYGIKIQVADFRRVHFDEKANEENLQVRPIEEYLIFDVGKQSYLEPITSAEKNKFRVTVYNPDKFTDTHRPGVHKYCITKALFDSDLIISLPKVKTHQKAGITAALKNIVGLNGDKDFLPHHRLGGTKLGGDCYPGDSKMRYWSELALDNANRNKGNIKYKMWSKIASLFWRLSFPKPVHNLAAGWHGNDTTWRMVMDLNNIVYFGRKDGSLASTQQRQFYSLCDGIIGGQGDGPLKPEPLNLGIVSFSNASGWNDLVMAKLMQIEIEKVPLLMAALQFEKSDEVDLWLNGELIDLGEYSKYSVETKMPPGWIDYKNVFE